MFNTFGLKTFSAAALLGMTVANIAAAEPIAVSSVNVTAEFSDMDSTALTFWPNIEADVGTALAAEVVDLVGTARQDVTVRIEELGLDGSPISATGEFNHIMARVIVRPEGTTGTTADFEVELLAATAPVAGMSPDAIVIPPAQGEFYAALVSTFAATVADKLAAIDTENAQPAIFEETDSANDDNAAADDGTDEVGTDDGMAGEDDAGTEGDAGTEEDTGTTDGTDTGAATDGSDAGGTDDGAVTE